MIRKFEERHFMTFQEKEELAEKILPIENTSVVAVLEDELTLLLHEKDVVENVSKQLFDELKQKKNELLDQDIISENEYLQATAKWRTT